MKKKIFFVILKQSSFILKHLTVDLEFPASYMLILFSYFSCKVLTYILLAKLAISDNGLNSMPKSTRRCDCSLLNILDTLRHNDKVRTNDNEINRTRSSWASSTILSIPATTTRHTTDFEIVNLHQRFTYLTGYCPATNL